MEDKRDEDIQYIKERLTRIEVMLENTLETRKMQLDNINKEISNVRKDSDYKDNELSVRIAKLENANMWLWRTVLGGIIAFILEFFLKMK